MPALLYSAPLFSTLFFLGPLVLPWDSTSHRPIHLVISSRLLLCSPLVRCTNQHKQLINSLGDPMPSSTANPDTSAGTEDPSPTLSTTSNQITTSTTSSSSANGLPLPPNVHAVVAQTENVDQVIGNQLEYMDATARARDIEKDGVNGDSSSNNEDEGVHNAL